MKIRITERKINAVPAADEEELEEDYTDLHCKGCMGACFGDCGNCRHMKEGASC